MMENSKIKTLLIDDESLARDYLRLLLAENEEVEIVGECNNGFEAVRLIEQLNPDLIFLDVQMPEMDGFAVLQKLDQSQLPIIIFTTAYQQYALRAFEFHALDYLLKPFDRERFTVALNRAAERRQNESQRGDEQLQITELLKNVAGKPLYPERFLIKLNGRIIFLKAAEIDWVKADDKYVHLFSGQTSHLVRQTLSAIKQELDPAVFVQVHRSAIINIERIGELQQMFNGEYRIVLHSGAKITVSRGYKDQLFNALGKSL